MGGRGYGRWRMAGNNDASTGEKTIPHNIEAEKSVLAACMLNADILEEIMLKLQPENFFRPAHRIMFEGVRDLHARRIPVDQI